MAHRKPSVVHLSSDYSDGIDKTKTRVISSLIDLTSDALDNTVISLTRKPVHPGAFTLDLLRNRGRPRLKVEQRELACGTALDYHAPSHGLYLRTMLEQLGKDIADRLVDEPPELLVGHKLTIEGIAVAEAARRLGRPYAITIQGNTDTKILDARPDLRPLYREIFRQAAVVVSFAPWSLEAVVRKLGRRDGKTSIVPCPTELDTPLAPRDVGQSFLSVFHLCNAHTKNLDGMARALRRLDKEGAPAMLAIVGGGGDGDLAYARWLCRHSRKVVFEGPLGRGEIAARMNRATALVMPSRRESFGLVFIEALFAGLPVIYPADRAIAGYFSDCPFAIPVRPGDTQGLATAMRQMIDNQGKIKAELKQWQSSADARRFTRSQIAAECVQLWGQAAAGRLA